MVADKKILFIEGATETSNGNLRQGFEKLLQKKLLKMPRIIMGGGKKHTIDKFKNNRFEAKQLLLCDLDASENNRLSDLQNCGLLKESNSVFYMIQEMESWFLSQPDVLDNYYGPSKNGNKVSEKINNRTTTEIGRPKEVLKEITSNLNKGRKYHEVNHAQDLLEKLDATRLEKDFPDFKKLIDQLKN